jgi:5-formyltetrahydrofolate cyclo-ligase
LRLDTGPDGGPPTLDVDPPTRKRTLRAEVPGRIHALPDALRRLQERRLIEDVLALPGFDEAQRLLLYAPAFPEEIDTRPLLRLVLRRGKTLVLPRVRRRPTGLTLYHVRDLETDLRPGVLGIPEPGPMCPVVMPEEVDWVLVPGVAFNERGMRLGRGAGHYDRLLPKLRPEVPRWAIAFEDQCLDTLPAEPHDQPLDGILTPDRAILGERWRSRRGR